MSILLFIARSFWLALPAVVANMMPVLVKNHFKFLGIPVDLGKKWKGKPIFGKNKTVRGFVFAVLGGIVICFIQSYLYQVSSSMREITLIDYSQHHFAIVGFLIGFGALLGDLAKSFFKRRAGIEPGGKFFPWDQIDVLVGALVFLAIIYIPPWPVILFLLIITPLLHRGLNILGYILKIKDRPW